MNESEQQAARPALRASDADRDQITAQLQHHYAVGRLTLPELEERVTIACQARTRDQLDALTADLPVRTDRRAAPGVAFDPRVLTILLCTAPPAALVYWLVCQNAGRRRRSPRPRA